MTNYDDKVLGLVGRADYRPLTLKAMSKRFEVGPEDYAKFRAAVKMLVKDGRLELNKDKTLTRPSADAVGKGTVLGIFKRSAKGFGFVKPHHASEKSEQIFIPAKAGRDASSGDEVVVKLTKKGKGPGVNPEGKVVQVVARASGIFVGTYYERGGDGLVRVDGTTFHDPVHVGDPGAKGAKPGDKVAIEMVRYPTPYQGGEGVVTEVLGPKGQPGVDTLAVIRAFNIPDVFDAMVLDEARAEAKGFDEANVEGREDLRDRLTVTIDPATARDFDDAISLSRDDKGYWNLDVHIADVGHFVKAGSELDRSARNRGTSVYLPDRVIPMLPEILSNSLASLQAGKTRYTLTAHLQFSGEGVRTYARFSRSAIQVDHRFTYEQAFAVMKRPEDAHEGVAPEVAGMVALMLELAMILRKRRLERGALELNMPEVEVDLGDRGEVVGAHLASNDESHQVIEEFMLAANEAVATHLGAKGVGFLRRAHANPEPYKLEEFAEFARGLGLRIDQPQSRFELQRVLAESAEGPLRYAVHFGLLRSLKQANYTPDPEGHYALASENYCHFTSPIRRYPDLQVHRQLNALIEEKKPKSDHDELAVLGVHCTRTERRAEAAERELIKIKLLTFLTAKIGETFEAVIIGVEDFGLFCRLDAVPADGLVHVTSLGDDYYYQEPETRTLIGRRSGKRYRLGDRIAVRIARVDVDRRELDLALAVPGESRDEAEAELPPSRTARPGPPRVQVPPEFARGGPRPTPGPGGSSREKKKQERKAKTKGRKARKGRRGG